MSESQQNTEFHAETSIDEADSEPLEPDEPEGDHESDDDGTTVKYEIEGEQEEAPVRYEIAGSGTQDAAKVISVGTLEKMGNTGAYVHPNTQNMAF